jgi:threonine dehydrogenase-like Zn-dependent dehydrogenase
VIRSERGFPGYRRVRGPPPVHLHGGPAPVRQYLPEMIELIWNRRIDPGKVFDLELPLDEAAEAYRAMDERRAIKAMLRV